MQAADDVTRYLEERTPEVRAALARVYDAARRIVPDAVEGRSYDMPALLYRGKGLVSTLETRRFLSIYPFSGKVIATMADDLVEFERTTGSIHYGVDHQLSDAVLTRLVELRRDEIDRTAR
jgi:uncharacterized protein YdhG (YjbR/CyaY superfamily)